jgi:hypothetical protein
MKSVYKGVAKSKFLPILLKRRQTKVVRLSFKNTGSKPWYDTSKLKQLPREVAVSVRLVDNTEDFFIRPGESPDSPSKKFGSVKDGYSRRSNDLHTVAPGETVTVPVMIIGQRYTRPGIYKLKIGLATEDRKRIDASSPAGVKVIVWRIPSVRIALRDIWRSIKLPLIQKGKVSYTTTNSAFAKKSGSNVPVVMCTWKRPENLQTTIDLLRNQTKPVVFYVWNNNEKIRNAIDEIVRKEKKLPIHVSHSASNIGGFGRFYQARSIANEHKYVIFIDDDQTFDKNMAKDFKNEARPKSIYSQWSYRIKDADNYWRRRDTREDEQAHYIGTCGMISDTDIFSNERLYTCPNKYWFVEDFWLSYIADTEGWRLRKSQVKFDTHDDGKDQMNFLIDKKIRMFKYLIKNKDWKVAV